MCLFVGNRLELDPKNKSLKKELKRSEKELENYEPPETKDNERMHPQPSFKPPASTSHTTKPSSSNDNLSSQSKGNGEMRGYKLTSDGKKTTYFNNELSDEARELIGDITPQRIETQDQNGNIEESENEGDSSSLKRSEWNKTAGTWEDRLVKEDLKMKHIGD